MVDGYDTHVDPTNAFTILVIPGGFLKQSKTIHNCGESGFVLTFSDQITSAKVHNAMREDLP